MPSFAPTRTLASLAYPDYRRLWITICGTSTNQWMEQVLLAWLVYDLTGNPLALGALSVVRAIPTLVLGPLGGLAADRMHRPRLMVGCQAAQLVAVCALLAASLVGALTVAHLYAFAAVSGGVWAFSQPVRQALLPSLVPPDRLSNAVALQSAGFQLTRMVAPGIAGLLLAGFGPSVILGIEVVLASVVMLTTGGITQASPAPAGSRESILASYASAVAYLRSNPPLLAIILIGFIPTLTATPYQTLLPVLARDVLQVGPEGYGLLASMSGWGAGAVTLLVASSSELTHKARIVLRAGAGQGAVLLLLAGTATLPTTPWVGWASAGYLAAAAVLVIMGAAVMAFNTLSTALVQTLCSAEMRGRVMSIFLLDIGIAPVGNTAVAALAGLPALGVPVTYAIMGAATTVSVITAHRLSSAVLAGADATSDHSSAAPAQPAAQRPAPPTPEASGSASHSPPR